MRTFRVKVNDSEYKVEIEELLGDKISESVVQSVSPTPVPTPKPASPPSSQPAAEPKSVQGAGGAGAISAPMPGTIIRVDVNVGDKVSQGQTLLVLEAMKMENEIQAPADGMVQDVNISQGVSVNAGETLIVLS